MQIFDASSILHAWEEYPIEIFVPMWEWIGDLVESGEIRMASVNLDEVRHMSRPCYDWLVDRNIEREAIVNADLANAVNIAHLIDVVNDQYHPAGVDENDIFAISVAKRLDVDLISDEAAQANLPQKRPKYKIPAVCALESVSVRCLKFRDWLVKMGPVF